MNEKYAIGLDGAPYIQMPGSVSDKERGTSPKLAPIPASLNELAKYRCEISELLHRLRDRLEPALMPEDPKKNGNVPGNLVGGPPLLAAILAEGNYLAGICSEIKSLLERLAL